MVLATKTQEPRSDLNLTTFGSKTEATELAHVRNRGAYCAIARMIASKVIPSFNSLGVPLMCTATWKRQAGESQCGWLLTQQVVRAVMSVLCNCPTYDVWWALVQAAKPNDFSLAAKTTVSRSFLLFTAYSLGIMTRVPKGEGRRKRILNDDEIRAVGGGQDLSPVRNRRLRISIGRRRC